MYQRIKKYIKLMQDRYIIWLSGYRNAKMLKPASSSEKVRVVFLVYMQSMWKLDTVFEEMLADPFFEPVILICPYRSGSNERMRAEMASAYNFFAEKKYPVISSRVEKEKWLAVDALKPSLVFFTMPWNYSKGLYYTNICKKYLTCYASYGLTISADRNYAQFNQLFHNLQWLIFVYDSYGYGVYKNHSIKKGENTVLTGAPFLEGFFSKQAKGKDVEHKGKTKKRVIYAPHHTIYINEKHGYQLSTFLNYGEIIKDLAIKYSATIDWVFKPHPHLKAKLYAHPNWGRKRTDEYYDFWDNSSNTQLAEGAYESLFLESDAMIHDCSSFLVEYLTLQKPVMYLMSEHTINSLNSYGREALNCCTQGESEEDIEAFLLNIISGNDQLFEKKLKFYNKYFQSLYANEKPSSRIIEIIKENLH